MIKVRNVFFTMSEESKAYRLYDPSIRKIMVSRDVNFDETNRWNWESEEGKDAPECELEVELNRDVPEQSKEIAAIDNVAASTKTFFVPSPNMDQGRRETEHDSDSNFRAHTARRKRNPSWMRDFVVTRDVDSDGDLYDDNEVQSLIVFFTILLILRNVKRLLYMRNGEGLWILRLNPLKRTRLGSYETCQ